MSFMNPGGLWLLLGVPVLILIWLLKPPYKDQVVSSSYIWRLSDRFMKRKMPAVHVFRWILFAVELLLVIGISMAAAKPVLNHGDRIDYVAILDTSASMRFAYNDKSSRYDEAVERLSKLADETGNGHRVSVLLAGEKAEWLVKDSESESEIQTALARTECGYGSSDLSDALHMAQLYADSHANPQVILYTDQEVSSADGVKIQNVYTNAWNVSVLHAGVSRTSDGMEIVARVISRGKDFILPVGLRIDGKLKQAKEVQCVDGETEEVTFSLKEDYQLLSVELSAEDDFSEDNQWMLMSNDTMPCKTLLVSDTPLYLSTALQALNRGEVATSSVSEYTGQETYDLVLFEGMLPQQFPSGSDVLLVNPERLPDGLTETGENSSTGMLAALGTEQEKMVRDMSLTEITVARHIRVQAGRDWQTLLYCDGDPVYLTKTESDGSQLSVLLFDLHESNLPMLTDFLVLLRNLMNTAAPSLVEQTQATVGEAVTVSIPRGTSWLKMTSADGRTTKFTQDIPDEIIPSEPGRYVLQISGQEASFFSHIPEKELVREKIEAAAITPADGVTVPEQAASPFWPILAGVLLILLIIEWGVYHYE